MYSEAFELMLRDVLQRERIGQCLHFVFLSVVITVHCWLADSLSRLSVCLATLVLSAALSLPAVSKHSGLFHPSD